MRRVWPILVLVVTISIIRAILVGDGHFWTVFFNVFNLLSIIQSHCNCYCCVKIRSIILIKFLYRRKVISVDSGNDIFILLDSLPGQLLRCH